MTLPLYTIKPDGAGWQVCLRFRDDELPIPGRRFTTVEAARLSVRQMEREDYELWQQNSLNASAEIQDPSVPGPYDDGAHHYGRIKP